jgi:hypothetical protein
LHDDLQHLRHFDLRDLRDVRRLPYDLYVGISYVDGNGLPSDPNGPFITRG